MLDLLSAVGEFAASHLVEPVAVAVVTALATTKVVRGRDAGGKIAEHDRRAAELNEDLRRWITDRDRAARLRVNEIAQKANAMGVARGGALAQAESKVYAHALRDYRDEAIAKRRDFVALLAAEERPHARYRRRRRRAAPVLAVPDDCCEILRRWRRLAAEDVSQPELEPSLFELERSALAA